MQNYKEKILSEIATKALDDPKFFENLVKWDKQNSMTGVLEEFEIQRTNSVEVVDDTLILKTKLTIKKSLEPEKVLRVWPSGRKTLGELVLLGTHSEKSKPFYSFRSLEDYKGDGGVSNGSVYSLGDFEYISSVGPKRDSFINATTKKDYSVMRTHFKYPTSIKRKSDDCLFSIGDQTNKGVIKGFRELTCFIEITTDKGIFYLEELSERTKLFKTEDGVDVFEGDDCWSVLKDTLKLGGKVNYNNQHPYKHALYFSTKEKAEEYMLLNEKLLSIKDIQSIYISANPGYQKSGSGVYYYEELLKLAKTNKSNQRFK